MGKNYSRKKQLTDFTPTPWHFSGKSIFRKNNTNLNIINSSLFNININIQYVTLSISKSHNLVLLHGTKKSYCYGHMKYKFIPLKVNWSCIIHWLCLCRGERLPQWEFWIWHLTVWWLGSSNAGALGNAEYLLIAIAPRFTLAQSGSI